MRAHTTCKMPEVVAKDEEDDWRDENLVQWKRKNIKDGLIVVDEAQLSKLIKREPIDKYYKVEAEPFAKGLFASVRRCQSLHTGESFAAKFSSRDKYGEDCTPEIYHEIALLSLCGGAPRIVQIHDVFENDDEVVLVMEYAPGGDLQTIIDDNLVPFESDVVSFIRQTVEGLEYLHKRRIAHLDIKPQNIVMMGEFPNCEIKLCDLEISRVILEDGKIRDFLGTPDYVAPEVIHYDPITLATDMWSLGVTTYVLLTGFTPFGGETDQETFCNISRGEVDFPEELFGEVSQDGIDFIKSLLVKDPTARPTASDCLKHPWLQKTRETKTTNQAADDPEKMLRKYLSKSREALFEKVVQQQQQKSGRRDPAGFGLRRRLCESQVSLVSKSRERLALNGTCSRSIEKLYGLRTLSKSQEVLNLCRNGSLLTSRENLDKVSEMLRSRELLAVASVDANARERRLIRAVTTDLGSLGGTRERGTPRTYSGSSTTSLASVVIEQTTPSTPNTPSATPSAAPSAPVTPSAPATTADDQEEPRFTVAQLVTAYNRHQELVTRTSLEVTMTSHERKVKIPPVVQYEKNATFPTGPTALRLFIPDIDLVGNAKREHRVRKPTSVTASTTSCQTRIPEEEKSEERTTSNKTKTQNGSSPFEIIGMRDDGPKKGTSYKIEFEGPKTTKKKTTTSSRGIGTTSSRSGGTAAAPGTKKYSVRSSPTRGTISSNLKAKEQATRNRK